MITRREILTALAVVPLAACSSSEKDDAPTTAASTATSTNTSPSAATSSDAGSTTGKDAGKVVVFLPGALATQVKPLTAAYAGAGLGEVTFEVGHTPIQREQLAKGAKPDVWIAANPDDMAKAASAGHVAADKVVQLARTKLALVVPADNPGKVEAITDLAKDGMKVLLAADTLPIWKASAKSFAKVEQKSPGFTKKAIANSVSREMGVQPIVTKIAKGVADVGLVFVTDVGADRTDVKVIEIPDELNAMLPFSIAPVTAGENADGATAFIEFMTAGAGRQALDKAGYLPPAQA